MEVILLEKYLPKRGYWTILGPPEDLKIKFPAFKVSVTDAMCTETPEELKDVQDARLVLWENLLSKNDKVYKGGAHEIRKIRIGDTGKWMGPLGVEVMKKQLFLRTAVFAAIPPTVEMVKAGKWNSRACVRNKREKINKNK